MTNKNNIVDFNEAERNARKRDLEDQKEKFKVEHNDVDQDAVNQAMETLSKATGKDIYIGTKKSPQSKVRFAQIIQENLKFFSKHDYLTLSEKGFLIDIIPYVAFHSNALVFDIKSKNVDSMNISELAKELERPRDRVNKVVNSLVKKGLLAKAESVLKPVMQKLIQYL